MAGLLPTVCRGETLDDRSLWRCQGSFAPTSRAPDISAGNEADEGENKRYNAQHASTKQQGVITCPSVRGGGRQGHERQQPDGEVKEADR